MNEPPATRPCPGAILQPSTRPDCECGVLYIEVSAACHGGLGTIGSRRCWS